MNSKEEAEQGAMDKSITYEEFRQHHNQEISKAADKFIKSKKSGKKNGKGKKQKGTKSGTLESQQYKSLE